MVHSLRACVDEHDSFMEINKLASAIPLVIYLTYPYWTSAIFTFWRY